MWCTVGDRLADAVPRKLATKKLKADAACIFVKHGLAVVKVNVTGIDLMGLIARQVSEKQIRQVRSVYRCWNRCGTGAAKEEEMAFHILKRKAEVAFQSEVWAQIESQCLSSMGGQIEAKLGMRPALKRLSSPSLNRGRQASFSIY